MPTLDMAKLQDVAQRLRVASVQPGYNMEVFDRFMAEASEACGPDHQHFIEFMASHMPADVEAKQDELAPAAAGTKSAA